MLSIPSTVILILISLLASVVPPGAARAALPSNSPTTSLPGLIRPAPNFAPTGTNLTSRQEFPASFFYCGDFDCGRCLVEILMNPQTNRCANVGGFRSYFIQQPSGEGFPFDFVVMMDGCLNYLVLPGSADTLNRCFNFEIPEGGDQFTCWGLAENVPGIDI